MIRTRQIIILIILITMIAAVLPAASKRTGLKLKTTKGGKEPIAKVDMPVEAKGDTIIFGHEVSFRSISFSGFDKPAASDKETFLILNHNPLPLTGLKIQISYFTASGELLHRRLIDVSIDVPPGERRLAEVKSFDTQHSYIYRESIASRRPAVPFTVRMKIVSARFAPLRKSN